MRSRSGFEDLRWPKSQAFVLRSSVTAWCTLVLATLGCLAVPVVASGAGGFPGKTDSIHLSKKFRGHLPITELTEDEAISHALNRLAYGPRPGDVERIRQIGLEKWIDQQLHPESINDSALDDRLEKYPTLKMSSKQLLEEFPQPNQAAKVAGETKQNYLQQLQEKRQDAVAQVVATGNDNIDKAQDALAKIIGPNRPLAELSMAKLDRAVYSNRQLETVLEDFWFNHFNIFANKGDDRWLLTSYVRDTIRPNTMGKFQDLLIATAKSPAMLFYLDNWMSVDPVAFAQLQQNNERGRARFGGVFAGGLVPAPGEFPHPSAQPLPGQGQVAKPQQQQDRGLNENYGREVMELHTVGVDAGYTQQDVIGMAECLTGWTISQPRRDPQFQFRNEWHAPLKKVVMGRTFNYGGEKDGEEALKMLATDRHTARFISLELARHFVSDNPSPTLVTRMAQNYEETGGDIRSVMHTMIYSSEFWSRKAYRAKVKTPFELVASAARALDTDLVVSLPAETWVARMGEPLFLDQPPTGYSDKSDTWVNAGALLNRLNFGLTIAGDRMAGARTELAPLFGNDAASDPQAALKRALDLFLNGQVGDTTKQTLEAHLNDPQLLQARLDDPVKKVNEGLLAGLVLGAPEFQQR